MSTTACTQNTLKRVQSLWHKLETPDSAEACKKLHSFHTLTRITLSRPYKAAQPGTQVLQIHSLAAGRTNSFLVLPAHGWHFTRTSSVPIEAGVLVLHLVLLAARVMGVQPPGAQCAATNTSAQP